MLARASPLNPMDLMLCKSSNADSFDVVWRSHSIGRSSNYRKRREEDSENVENAKVRESNGVKSESVRELLGFRGRRRRLG